MIGDRFTSIALAALAVCAPLIAFAQTAPRTDRGYASVGGVLQSSSSFSETVRPVDFAEAAVVDTGYKSGPMPGVEFGGGVHVWRSLGAGVVVSWVSKDGTGAVSAQVPHPFLFARPRSVSGDATGLAHSETAIHIQATWMVPLRNRWRLALSGGPSWFSVDQDLVSDVTVNQTYPYDTATFASATSVHRSGSQMGFNAAADASYWLRPRVGVGVGMMFSHASIKLDKTATMDAGGPHLSAGIRFRF
jgi:hypothetical protein